MSKKYCSMCGCIMDPKHDGEICEVCLDELYESDPGEDDLELMEELDCLDLEDQFNLLMSEDEPGYPYLAYYDEHDAREEVDYETLPEMR